ncbi:AraC family transcriptional regulator [Paenibacillus sp. EC2-1]|uniref:AraC family transcriptional regulator n=1 Tax=Paenibacillus sp. EC2-1 TaxID=3388665 RepID=UPI003BEEF756
MQDYGHEIAEYLYYLPESLDKEGVFWLLRAGIMTAKPGYYAGPKRISSYSMHFVSKGKVILKYGREQVVLEQGDIFCLFPMQTYVYREYEDTDNLEMCWLNMDGPGMEQMLKRSGFSPSLPYVQNRWTLSLQKTINSIIDRMKQDKPITSALRLENQSLLYQLFSQLLDGSREESNTEPDNWLKRSIEYIEMHAAEGISVQQVAEWAGVSRTYFSTMFSNQTGMTPMMYITKVRMDRAMRMLVDTDCSITEIAYTLGYPTLYSFTRAFKNKFSLSPTEYRNHSKSLHTIRAPKE